MKWRFPVDPDEARERLVRIDAMIAAYKGAKRRRLESRAIYLWRRAEARHAAAGPRPRNRTVH